MNWRAFVVSLVQAIAWPSVLLTLIVVFRRQIAQVLQTGLESLKAGPFEAKFQQSLSTARNTIELAASEVANTTAVNPASRRDQLELIRRHTLPISPRAAVTAAAHLAEAAVYEAALPHFPSDGYCGSSEPINAARRGGALTPIGAIAFDQVRSLGWRLQDQPGITEEQGSEYIRLVDEALMLLETANRRTRSAELPEMPESVSR